MGAGVQMGGVVTPGAAGGGGGGGGGGGSLTGNNSWTGSNTYSQPVIAPNMEGTTGAVTLEVSSTGNDSDPARPARILSGDFSSTGTNHPFATIQAAVDSLPKILRHLILIKVDAGTFAGAVISGFVVDRKFSGATLPIIMHNQQTGFAIVGKQVLSTLATGSNTGTATGGSSATSTLPPGVCQLTLSTATWTVNDLRGRYLNIIAGKGQSSGSVTVGPTGLGNLYLIASNTATAINFLTGSKGAFAPDSTTQFQIVDPATLVQAAAAPSALGSALFVQDCMTMPQLGMMALGGNSASNGLTVRNSFGSSSLTDVLAMRCDGSVNAGLTSGLSFGSSSSSGCASIQTEANYFKSLSSPFFAQNVAQIQSESAVLDTCGAVQFQDSLRCRWSNTDQNNGTGVGLNLNNRCAFMRLDNLYINNQASDAIQITGDLYVDTFLALNGTGNGGFGVKFTAPCFVVTSNIGGSGSTGISLTGTSGDLSLNGQTLTWAGLAAMTSGTQVQNGQAVLITG